MSLGRLGDEMASVPSLEHTEARQDLAVVAQLQHEQFAVLVASGLSYREAARRAGYNPDNSWRLRQTPAIRERVEELVREPDARVKAGIELELVMLRNRVADGDLTDADRADIELRLKLLLAHAKLRGWIVDKKQVAKLSASVRLDRAELAAALEADLERLAPGATGQLARLGRAPSRSDLTRIAAGEDHGTASAEE
jgi:hypothetical protein